MCTFSTFFLILRDFFEEMKLVLTLIPDHGGRTIFKHIAGRVFKNIWYLLYSFRPLSLVNSHVCNLSTVCFCSAVCLEKQINRGTLYIASLITCNVNKPLLRLSISGITIPPSHNHGVMHRWVSALLV